jgi:hypothetical protein
VHCVSVAATGTELGTGSSGHARSSPGRGAVRTVAAQRDLAVADAHRAADAVLTPHGIRPGRYRGRGTFRNPQRPSGARSWSGELPRRRSRSRSAGDSSKRCCGWSGRWNASAPGSSPEAIRETPTAPGSGLYDELELLVRAGLTPMRALQGGDPVRGALPWSGARRWHGLGGQSG